MNPVTVAIQRVKYEIPRDLLNQAFQARRYDPLRRERYSDNTTAVSLDELIRIAVIEGRVSIDLNLLSGSEVLLPLILAEAELIDRYNAVYRFSKTATAGRTITNVYEVTYGYAQNSSVGNYGGYGAYNSRSSQLLSVGKDILKSAAGSAPTSTAYVQIIAHNTVLINDINPIHAYGALRCMISNDPNFSNLRPAYYRDFGELVVLATKAYVYNQLVIDLDEGQLRGGLPLGRIREIVDQYADANQMYNELVDTKWQKIGLMNDVESYRKVLKLNLGGKPKL